jgi:hypothetical protein
MKGGVIDFALLELATEAAEYELLETVDECDQSRCSSLDRRLYIC